MNRYTFQDAVASKRSALADDVENDDDDEEEAVPMRRPVEGEEDESEDKFNEMGVVIEPFNLKNEREDGYFDKNMNFIFKKEHGEVDAWVANLNESEMEAAIGEAALAAKKLAQRKEQEEKKSEKRPRRTIGELKEELLAIMQPGESISSTMRRLSGKTGTESSGIKRRTPGDKSQTEPKLSKQEEQKRTKEIAKQNRHILERITEIADELISNGLSGIYQVTYDVLKASTSMWEYKGMDGKLYGPYSFQHLAEWRKQGYLAGDQAVMMRRVVPPSISSASAAASSMSIYDDEDLDSSEPATKKGKTSETTSVARSSVTEDPNDWISSDDIDFSGFINIDESRLDLGKSTASSSYRKASAPVSDGDDDDDDGEDDGDSGDNQGYRRNRRSVKFEDDDD